MTPARLLADLRGRGVALCVDGAALEVDAPAGLLTPADREALRQHRDELIGLLSAEAVRPPVSVEPCLGCGTSAWFWCADWPEPDTGRWLCATCSRRPVPTLHEVAAGLTADEHRLLEAEAAAGDPLAHRVLALIEGRAPEATPA